MRLAIRVEPSFLPDLHVSEQHPLRITLGGVVLCDAAPGAKGYSPTRRGRWRYRGEVAGGRVRVVGNARTGMLRLAVSRASLPDLRSSPAVDLPLSIECAGVTLETEASFHVIDRRVRRWRGLSRDFRPGPGPHPGPDPDPDPGPGDPPPLPSKDAILSDLAARGISVFQHGAATPAGGFDAATLRCPSGAPAEGVPLAVPPPGSADFFTDTAYVCRGRGQYWVHRTGGFAGVSLWVGPYAVP